MLPCAQVVTGPHGSIPLGAGIEGAGKDEGTLVRGRPLFDGLRCDVHKEHAVDVVNISMFPATVMNGILFHRDLWSVENRRLPQKGVKVDIGL